MAAAFMPMPSVLADPHGRSSAYCAGLFKADLALLLLKYPRHSLSASSRLWFRPLRASLKQAGSGTREEEGWQLEKILTVGETLIIVLGAASHISTQLRASVASTTSPPDVAAKQHQASSLQVILLWAALVMNSFLRARRGQAVSLSNSSSEVRGSAGLQLSETVTGLEEELRQGLILTRGVARQLEKLGVRVRTMRQTLRNPIQAMHDIQVGTLQTARIATETFEVMGALVSRQDILERQLQELTQVLLAMQEQQAKQLKLVGTALRKISKSYSEDDKRGHAAQQAGQLLDIPSANHVPFKSTSRVDGRTPSGLVANLSKDNRGGEKKKPSGRVPASKSDWMAVSPIPGSTCVATNVDLEKKLSDVDFWADPSG